MNAKSKLWVNHEEQTILMNSIFNRIAKNTLSPEYEFLQKIRQDNPGYALSVRTIQRKANKHTYKGLTYEYMREYIILHTEGEERNKVLAHFDDLVFTSKCQAKAIRYPTIKNWFLLAFPAVKDFALAGVEPADAA